MCQIERLENREENGGNTPDRYRARATWNSIKMHIYGFLQSTKGLKSPFHFEDGGYEIDSATLSWGVLYLGSAHWMSLKGFRLKKSKSMSLFSHNIVHKQTPPIFD